MSWKNFSTAWARASDRFACLSCSVSLSRAAAPRLSASRARTACQMLTPAPTVSSATNAAACRQQARCLRRTSAADTTATAARPRPARRPGSARCPAPGRWPSRSGGCGPSPGAFITIQSRSPADQLRQLRRLGPALGRDRRRGSSFDCAQPGAGLGRLLLADHAGASRRRPPAARRCSVRAASCRSAARRAARPANRRRCACRCPAASISACSGLMYSSVPTIAPNCGEQRPLGQPLVGRLGDAEVDHLGHRLAVVERHQDVRRLDVAVDDPLLVGVLDRLADRDEQLQPLARA